MNRLILIGNGFDLAHGLKTCYKDFIMWYMIRSFEDAHTNNHHNDSLIDIRRTSYFFKEPERRLKWVKDFISNVEHPKRRKRPSFSWHDEPRTANSSPYQVKYKSNLLEPLLSSCNTANWVDIEAEYYELLRDVLEMKNMEARQPELKKLNDSLKFLISQLQIYLSELPSPIPLKGYEEIFASKIRARELYPLQKGTAFLPNQTYVLNFNYTDTAKQYLNVLKTTTTGLKPSLNFIHGKLGDAENELIFGFGDETDIAYSKMEEDSRVKGYFDYVKSFWYLRTENYRSLVNFLDSDDFQVYVLGHSCGLSDRTMLRMIFEHSKCRSIKIYYYEKDGTDNFVNLTHEIARHFTDKGLMRKKIISKKRSSRMPQHDDKPSVVAST